MADDFDSTLPARFGDAQGKALERRIYAHVQDPRSMQTVDHLHANGGLTRLRTHGGLVRFTHVAPEEEEEERVARLPDILSGVVIGGYLDPADATLAGVLRTTPYSAIATGLHTGATWKTYRLAVPLSPHIAQPLETIGEFGLTQYRVVQPYKYTGKMRALVQWLLGAGVVPSSSRYDETLTLPDTCVPTQEAGDAVQIAYNYTFAQSHGIVIGEDGHPWVVMIDQALGVWAFLLPRIHGSELPQFYTALVDAELELPDELLTAWPMFKGIPTGETITPDTLTLWQRSGCAVKLLDVAEMGVYSESQGVASQLGWAFNYSGTEARVIAVKRVVEAGTDYKTAHYLRLQFVVGAVRDPLDTTALRELRARYVVPGAPAHVRLKAHFMSDADAYNVLAGHVAFDDVLSEPIATVTAGFSELETSVFWASSGEVKVWDDLSGFCMSMGLEERMNAPAGIVTTPVHVFYDPSDTLREVRIRPGSPETSGGPYIADVFETSGPSNGAATTQTSSSTRITGPRELIVALSPSNDLPVEWLKRWWSTTTQITTTLTGHTTQGVAFIPCGDRESVIFAAKRTHSGGTAQYAYTFNNSNPDRISYDLFDNYIIGENRQGRVRLISGCYLNDEAFGGYVDGITPIYAIDGSGVDGGEWATPCAKAFNQAWPNPDAGLTNHSDLVSAGGIFEFHVFADGALRLVFDDSGTPDELYLKYGAWFAASTPLPEEQQVMRATSNCIGASFLQCYDDINSGHYTTFGSLPMPEAESADYQLNYIGVFP